MKLKQIALYSTIAIILLFVTGKSLYLYIKLQKDYNRIQNNVVTLRDSLTYYTDSRGREVAQSPTVEYKAAELQKALPEVPAILKEMKIKPKRVESFAETEVKQDKVITVFVADTVIKIVNTITQAKTFAYSDPWYRVHGVWYDTTGTIHITSQDTIIQVVSYGKRYNPYLWFFSRRQLVQSIQSRNPSNKITYSKYIKIKK